MMTGYSKNTVNHFLQYYRELVACTLDTNDTMIGGPGIIIKVDESKFGKRKYHRGHRVDGVWVIGGVERSSSRGMFVEVVENRSAATIIEVLSRHICPESIV